MVTKQEFINQLTELDDVQYDKEKDTFTFVVDNVSRCISANKWIDEIKKKIGQSFECLYDEHIFCFSVIRCTECGTVIFEHYDENFEPNLKCPVCTDYHTDFKYWKKEDIKKDSQKQEMITLYLRMAKEQQKAEKKYIRKKVLSHLLLKLKLSKEGLLS